VVGSAAASSCSYSYNATTVTLQDKIDQNTIEVIINLLQTGS
jgi:hypothetical protein